ncbi:hypothetical protein GH733_000479 [Mirounga leonina]|nr:hypothetical protein GH733_000479 [Mirounga leonina]
MFTNFLCSGAAVPEGERQPLKALTDLRKLSHGEKLAKLQAQVRMGGKGTAHQKKMVHRTATADDQKLQFSLKKLGVNSISGIEEMNMFTNQEQRLAESLPTQFVDRKATLATGEEEDDEDSDLVENFDEASKDEAN